MSPYFICSIYNIFELTTLYRDEVTENFRFANMYAKSQNCSTALAESLRKNTTLKHLNLETNFLSKEGVCAVLRALNESGNTALSELKIDNQRQNFGPGGEDAIASLLFQNKSLCKFSCTFKFPGPRQKAVSATTRNADTNLRQKRNRR